MQARDALSGRNNEVLIVELGEGYVLGPGQRVVLADGYGESLPAQGPVLDSGPGGLSAAERQVKLPDLHAVNEFRRGELPAGHVHGRVADPELSQQVGQDVEHGRIEEADADAAGVPATGPASELARHRHAL